MEKELSEMTIEEKVEELRKRELINGQDGVWNENQYMAGFHNGIVMCLHILTQDESIKYKNLVGEGISHAVKAPEEVSA